MRLMDANPGCSGLDKQVPRTAPHSRDSDYEPVKHPYVPRWLPWRLEHEFLRRFHASVARAKARRRGCWRNHQDEVETCWHILGGLTNAYKYNRVSSAWGRRMRAKKAQKALQTKLAMRGEMVVEYFARLGQRGGQAKARKRREAVFRGLPPEARVLCDHQRQVLSGQRRTTRKKSWLQL